MGTINDYDVHVRVNFFLPLLKMMSQDQEPVRAVRGPEQQAELPGGGQHQHQYHYPNTIITAPPS